MKIIQDSREQLPWNFTFYGVEQEVRKLDTGDYSIDGLEDLICVERKRNTAEIAINLGSKWKTFEKELERMLKYKYRYLVCEFPVHYLDIFPTMSGIPANKINKIKINPQYIKSKLFKVADKYDMNLIFCDGSIQAQAEVFNVFQAIFQKNQRS